MFTQFRARADFSCIGIAFALAAALTFTPGALAAQFPSPGITVTPLAVAPGGTVTVAITNGPGSLTDWVAMYPAGAPNPAYLDWQYLNGLRTAPAIGVTATTLTFTLPTTTGTYDLRFMANDGFTLLGGATVIVGIDTAPPVISAVAASSITAAGATISWTTDEASDSQVEYGLTTGYGGASGLDGNLVTVHTVSLSGLTANTLYHVRVRSGDAAGNLATSADVTLTTLDGTAPTVALTAPAANATVSGVVTVSAAASDNVGVAGVQFQLDGAPLGAEDVAAPYTVSWNTTTTTDGAHTLRAVARDAATNQTTSTARSVTVDTTLPVISAVTASSITLSGATITWTTNETSTSQVNSGLTISYGTASTLITSQVTSHSIVLTGKAANTTYHYRVRSRDAATPGNLALSGDFTFTTLADVTPPTVSLSAPIGGATVTGAMTVSATASDNVAVAGVQFRLDGAALGAEAVAAPYTTAWNTSGSADLIFGVTKVIVGPMAMIAGSGFAKRQSVSCPGCGGEDLVSEDKLQTSAGPTAATWTFSIPARYLAQMAAFKAAGTPAYVQGAAATSNSASATITEPFGAGIVAGNLLVVAVAWQGNGAVSVTDSRANVYALATQAYDAVNGQSLAILYTANAAGGPTTVTASFSGTPPTVQRLEIHEYSGIATTSALDATATNSADGTTTANTITSGSAPTTVIAPVSDGSHTLTAVARDAAGNTTTSAAVTVTVNNGGDTTPPVIAAVAASSITGSGATISWTTNEASDSQVDYGVTTAYGSASALNGTDVTAHTASLGGLAGGALYHYRVRSRDAANNLALSGDFTLTTLAGADVTAPTVAVSAPSGDATVSGATTVSATASDDVGVAGVQFRLDGASLGAEDVAAPYTVSWNTQGSTDLVFGVSKVADGPMTISAGSGLTKRLGVSCQACTGDDLATEDKIQSSAGQTAATFTFDLAAHYLAQMAAFKATAPPAYVQGAVATSNSASSTLARAFGANVTAGNLLVVAVAWQGTSAVGVTDTRGNVYAVATSAYDAVNGQTLAILYAANAASGATTVTATFGATPTVQRLAIHEYSGIAATNPLDGTATNIADGTTTANAVTSGSTTTTVVALAADGSHTLTALARDEAGNTTTSAAVTVTVDNSGDTTPPVIAAVAASAITASGATITWTTNEASDSQVDYGLTTAYGSASALNPTGVTAHSIALSGLAVSATYHYRVRSRDAANNLATSADFTLTTLDGMAPTVALTAPAPNATVSATITVSATASDNVGVAGVQFRLDGAPLGVEDVVAPYAVSWNTTTATNGSHTLTAVARDAATNQTTSAAVSVTVANDTTPPVISAVAASSITGSGATMSWTTNEASDSQVDYGLTTAYGSASALNNTDVTAHAVSLSGLTGGTLYHIRVRSRDAAGNLALSGDVTFTTLGDATSPTVSISAPSTGATVGGAVTVTANASDNVGVAGVQFRLDGAPLEAEDVTAPYAISWTTQGSPDLVFGVSKVADGPMTIGPGTGFTKRLGVSCLGCLGDDLASEDKIQSVAGQTAATFTFDLATHYLAQMAAFQATALPAYVQGAVATSNNSGSSTTALPFDSSVSAGNLLVVAAAWQGNSAIGVTDNRGNAYAVATSAYDAVNGQTLAILYAANAASGVTTVTASFGATPRVQRLAIHEYSGIATTNPLDGTATNIADGTTTANAVTSGSASTTVTSPVSNGSHTLTALARDAAGNTTTSADVTVTVNNGGDTTPPVISSVTAGSITSSGATINWTTNEASDSQVDYGLSTAYGSTSPLNGSLITTHAVILGALASGTTYHIRARSIDAAGNLALSGDFVFATVAVDATAPVVSITAPAANATVSGTTTFSATATDNVGVAGVEFKLDGVLLAPEDAAAPYTLAWDTTTAANGSHTLTALAWDAAGNSATATRTVTVSNALAQVNLAWNANTESDLAGYKVYVGTTSGAYSTTYNVGNVIAYTITGLAPGDVYYFAVTAYDTGGFESGVSNEVSAAK